MVIMVIGQGCFSSQGSSLSFCRDTTCVIAKALNEFLNNFYSFIAIGFTRYFLVGHISNEV